MPRKKRRKKPKERLKLSAKTLWKEAAILYSRLQGMPITPEELEKAAALLILQELEAQGYNPNEDRGLPKPVLRIANYGLSRHL